MFKLSKKHLQVRARTWRPPPRDDRDRYPVRYHHRHQPTPTPTTQDHRDDPPSDSIPPTIDPSDPAYAQDTPPHQTHPPTVRSSPSPVDHQPPAALLGPSPIDQPPVESIHPSTEPPDRSGSLRSPPRTHQDFPEPSTRSASRAPPHPHRSSGCSQSLDDPRQSSRPSIRSRPISRLDPDPDLDQVRDRPSQSSPPPQAYRPASQSDSPSNLLPGAPASDLITSHPGLSYSHRSQNDDPLTSAFVVGEDAPLRIARENLDAVQRSLELAQRGSHLSKPPTENYPQDPQAQVELLYDDPERNRLSNNDILLRSAREQLELHHQSLRDDPLRSNEEASTLREKELRLKLEELQSALELLRLQCDEKIKLAQETAERDALEKIKRREADERRRLEEFQRESDEKQRLTHQECEEKVRRMEEEVRLQREAEFRERKRQEEEARIEEELERLRSEERIRAEQEAQHFAEEQARLSAQMAVRARIEQKERALRNTHANRKRRITELMASAQPSVARNINVLSFADVYSSPTLIGYSPPSSPPTPMSPHLVPEQVRKAARAEQENREKWQRELEEKSRMAQERLKTQAAEQLQLEEQRQAEEHERARLESEQRRQFDLQEDLTRRPAEQTRYSQRSRHPSIDASDRMSHLSGRLPGSAGLPHMDYPTQPREQNYVGQGQPSRSLAEEAVRRELERRHQASRQDRTRLEEERQRSESERLPSDDGRDRSSQTDERPNASAKTTLINQSPLGPNAPPSVSSHDTRPSQPKGSTGDQESDLPSQLFNILTERDNQQRQAEDAVLERHRAALAKARAEQQAILNTSGTHEPGREDDGSNDDSSVARIRAAEVAAHFMARQSFSKPSRRHKTSLSYAHRPRVMPHHQRVHSIETSSSAPTETFSESGSVLGVYSSDYIPGYAHEVIKEIESSVMLPIDRSSIDYLQNDPRGRDDRSKGEQLACKALAVIANDLGANAIISLTFPPPVLVDATRVNFSARGIAVIHTIPTSAQRYGFGSDSSHGRHAPLQSVDDALGSIANHEAASAPYPLKGPPTPAISLKSEPFDHSMPGPGKSNRYHSSQGSHGSLPHQPNDYDTFYPNRGIKKTISTSPRLPPLNSPDDSHRSTTTSHPIHYDSNDKPIETVMNSPRAIAEEQHEHASGVTQRPADLPIPPMFVTPKVTVQSPSDTTSPMNDSNSTHHPSQAKHSPISSPTSAVDPPPSPIKRSTSIARAPHPPRTIHEGFSFALPLENVNGQKSLVSTRIDSSVALPSTTPSGFEEPLDPASLALSSRVTNTEDVLKGVQDFETALNASGSSTYSPHGHKVSLSHQYSPPYSSRRSTLRGQASIAPERRQSTHQPSTSRAASRASQASNYKESTSIIMPPSPFNSFLPEQPLVADGFTFDRRGPLKDHHDGPGLLSQKRSSSQTAMKTVQQGKSDSTRAPQPKGQPIMRFGAVSEPQFPVLTENLVRSHSYPLNESVPLRAPVLFASPASYLTNKDSELEGLPTSKGADPQSRVLETKNQDDGALPSVMMAHRSLSDPGKSNILETVLASIMHPVNDKIMNIVAQAVPLRYKDPASSTQADRSTQPNSPSRKACASEKLTTAEVEEPSSPSNRDGSNTSQSILPTQPAAARVLPKRPEKVIPSAKFSPISLTEYDLFSSPSIASVGSSPRLDRSVNVAKTIAVHSSIENPSPSQATLDKPFPPSASKPSLSSDPISFPAETPIEAQSPSRDPYEKSLPPPTPRELPLPDSPIFHNVPSHRSSTSHASNESKSLPQISSQGNLPSSSSNLSPVSSQHHHPERFQTQAAERRPRFSNVWIGEAWDDLLEKIEGLRNPITPTPAFPNPHVASSILKSSEIPGTGDLVKREINSIPLIQIDEY